MVRLSRPRPLWEFCSSLIREADAAIGSFPAYRAAAQTATLPLGVAQYEGGNEMARNAGRWEKARPLLVGSSTQKEAPVRDRSTLVGVHCCSLLLLAATLLAALVAVDVVL